jgi:hypothetical protein
MRNACKIVVRKSDRTLRSRRNLILTCLVVTDRWIGLMWLRIGVLWTQRCRRGILLPWLSDCLTCQEEPSGNVLIFKEILMLSRVCMYVCVCVCVCVCVRMYKCRPSYNLLLYTVCRLFHNSRFKHSRMSSCHSTCSLTQTVPWPVTLIQFAYWYIITAERPDGHTQFCKQITRLSVQFMNFCLASDWRCTVVLLAASLSKPEFIVQCTEL